MQVIHAPHMTENKPLIVHRPNHLTAIANPWDKAILHVLCVAPATWLKV